MSKKRFVLFIQGEGRGHMTQAISMYEMLIEKGHDIPAVVLGSSGCRETPAFIFEKMKCKVYNLTSPNFVADKKNKSIKIGPSVLHNLKRLGTFRKSIKEIGSILEEHQPDAVINFFDLLIGLYYKFKRPSIPMICIAHQYIYLHKAFQFPKGFASDKAAIKFYTRITSSRSKKNLAISFYDIPGSYHKKTVIVPPLLRKEIFKLQPKKEGFYLIYLVNSGYFEDVVSWHEKNQQIVLHCFTDKSMLEGKFSYQHPNLHLHQVSDVAFLDHMERCNGLATTAGFESVCEAMYLEKPVLMVPIQGHFEQFCNSRDAVKAGAGIYDVKFDIQKLDDYSANTLLNHDVFKKWVAGSNVSIYKEVMKTLQ